ncbi:hypothetical protein NQ176_g11316 [Zarea fungicola]|uniref:Uncharacterized protein n=1 Tax=Zarea fungicola TaxID=93591 RepID=A0ACC1MBI5_9HYPO|nr:hypothetical protein NQ176_g11316 [Lecanicillium fungicola]
MVHQTQLPIDAPRPNAELFELHIVERKLFTNLVKFLTGHNVIHLTRWHAQALHHRPGFFFAAPLEKPAR